MAILWRGAEATLAEREGAERGLYLWAEYILEQAVNIVPWQEGTLGRSGVASPPDPGTLKAAVSFDTPYAVVQHENLTFHHPGGRQAKYLETPLNASREVGKTLIAQEIEARLI